MDTVKEILIRRGGIVIDGKPFDRLVRDINYSANGKDNDKIEFVCYVMDGDSVKISGDRAVTEKIKFIWE